MSDLESDMYKDARRPANREAVEQVDLLGTTDPAVWAREFARIFEGQTVAPPSCGGSHEVDESNMIGWFANAMQAKESALLAEEGTDQPDSEEPVERPYRFSKEQLHELVFLAAGAATAPLMRDSGLVMPSEEIIDGVNRILAEKALPTSPRDVAAQTAVGGGLPTDGED